MIVEQRRHIRSLPHENTFAVIGRKFTKVGKVKDICMGGLAIEYIAGENSNQEAGRVDVFMTGHVFHLYNVPCEMIYDIEIHVPRVNNKYVKILTTKRCGVKFGELNEDEQAQLELFIESHTTALT